MKIYKKQLIALTVLVGATLMVIIYQAASEDFHGCGMELYCVRRLMTSSAYQYMFLPVLALLISLIPLYFTKEAAWRTWRTFAVVYLPIAAIIISVTPTTASLAIGSDPKEIFTLWLSGLFVVISFLIALKKHFDR